MLGDGSRLYEVGGLLAAGYSLYQAKQLHDVELNKARERHKEAMTLAQEQHKKNLAEVKRTYLLELFNNLEQHFQQLNADLIASSKESERDMFDQRNQSFQTIILASSVMFTALSTAIVDGNLADSSSQLIIIAYALTSSLSFAFLFLCVVICIEIVMRASSFMYRRAHKHTEALRDAICKTKDMMFKLRNGARHRNRPGNNNNSSTEESREDEAIKSPASSIPTTESEKLGIGITNRKPFGRAIATMEEEMLEEEWRKHEYEIQRYLAEREKINDSCAVVDNSDDNSSKKSFQQFWRESCKFWAELAILFFYAGTLNLLISIMIFMWTTFLKIYQSLVAAAIAVSLISLGLVIGIATVVIFRMIQHNKDSKDKNINPIGTLSRESSFQMSMDEGSSRRGSGVSAEDFHIEGFDIEATPSTNNSTSQTTNSNLAAFNQHRDHNGAYFPTFLSRFRRRNPATVTYNPHPSEYDDGIGIQTV